MNRIFGRIFICTLTLLTLAGILFCCVNWYGSFHGEEFSPTHVARRTFSYREIPIFRIQVTAIQRHDVSNGLEKYLAQQDFIGNKNDEQTSWHLVFDNWTATDSPSVDSRFLCHYLDEYDSSGNLFWLQWSLDHPKLAKVLWPVVFKMAQNTHYLAVPNMMEASRKATNPDDLKSAINKICCEFIRDAALEISENGDMDGAVEQLELGRELECPEKELLKTRIEILKAHGETAKAKDIERGLSKIE